MRSLFLLLVPVLTLGAFGTEMEIVSACHRCDAPIETADWQAKIDAASAAGGGVVRVGPGHHRTGSLELKSNVTLVLEKEAVLEGVRDITHYKPLRFPFLEKTNDWHAVVYAVGATNIAIKGEGVIFGNGYNFGKTRPRGLMFYRTKGLSLEGVTLRDFASWTCYFKESEDIVVRNVSISSRVNSNNDGFDIEARNVLIENCTLDCGDDGLCFKCDNPDFVVENVEIRDCRVASTCNAIKIGTGTHGSFRKLNIHDCTVFVPTRTFLRGGKIAYDKTAEDSVIPGADLVLGAISGIAIECVDGGTVEDVTVRNIDLKGALVPIFVRLGDRRNRSCGIPHGGKGILRDILIENITGEAHCRIASSITGVDGYRPQNIVLRNVNLLMPGGATVEESEKPVADDRGGYPEASMFGSVLPAYGLYIRGADGVVLDNVNFTLRQPDPRPAVVQGK